MSNDTTTQQQEFSVGDKVTWTHTSSSGKSISFKTRRGVITELTQRVATVKTPNNRQLTVFLSQLRHAGQKTQLTEMFDSLRTSKTE